jgi:predicted DCC family thiol-disulfide oxidoreductase YuxK
MDGAPVRSPVTEEALGRLNLVLFDGVCRSCHWAVGFIARRDPGRVFHFVPQQSPLGQRLLARHGLARLESSSIVLIEGGRAFSRSTAVLRIVRRLSGPVRFLSLLLLVPRILRDPVYDLYARNRYRLFGRSDTCLVPSPDLATRFLDEA